MAVRPWESSIPTHPEATPSPPKPHPQQWLLRATSVSTKRQKGILICSQRNRGQSEDRWKIWKQVYLTQIVLDIPASKWHLRNLAGRKFCVDIAFFFLKILSLLKGYFLASKINICKMAKICTLLEINHLFVRARPQYKATRPV